ncbi:hypothetical protein [Burkholderia multivorans]|uniref:hypothetical protein n=1 Tax=Burkholderia multivorans TaxID=87883 RepID=UPI001C27E684|nr:hypothetical protein [Burkholderia multivorans]MBU9526163.1 hypothetical protein [Burkholderia multivorans]
MKKNQKIFACAVVALTATMTTSSHALTPADKDAMSKAVNAAVAKKAIKCGQIPNRVFMKMVNNSTSSSYYELADLKFVNLVGSEQKPSLADSLNGKSVQYSGTVKLSSAARREYLVGYKDEWLNWSEVGVFATVQIEKSAGKWSAKVVSGPDTSGNYSEYSDFTCSELPSMPPN